MPPWGSWEAKEAPESLLLGSWEAKEAPESLFVRSWEAKEAPESLSVRSWEAKEAPESLLTVLRGKRGSREPPWGTPWYICLPMLPWGTPWYICLPMPPLVGGYTTGYASRVCLPVCVVRCVHASLRHEALGSLFRVSGRATLGFSESPERGSPERSPPRAFRDIKDSSGPPCGPFGH